MLINYNLDPVRRAKMSNTISIAMIPGTIKDFDSFLLPIFEHVLTIEREGFPCYDAHEQEWKRKTLFLALGLFDHVMKTEVANEVGHHGFKNCHLLGCDWGGIHVPSGGFYYNTLFRPIGYPVSLSIRPEFSMNTFFSSFITSSEYHRRGVEVQSIANREERLEKQKQYGNIRTTLFSVIPSFAAPFCFALDIMHMKQNLCEFLIGIWRGEIKPIGGYGEDLPAYVCLTGETWISYSHQVREIAKELPAFLGRCPRLPHKFLSRFKNIEWDLMLFAIAPGVLNGILPEPYYSHYLDMVSIINWVRQRSVDTETLNHLEKECFQWVVQFENLYFKRDWNKIVFCRVVNHKVLHIAGQIRFLGPLYAYAQYQMERFIGHVTGKINLPSNPISNLNAIMYRMGQFNSLNNFLPDLSPSRKTNESI
jgi:hypothetical protein